MLKVANQDIWSSNRTIYRVMQMIRFLGGVTLSAYSQTLNRMANRIRDDEDPSMQSNAGGSCCAHRAQNAQQEVQEALQEKILEILKNYLDGKNVNIESLRQLDHGTKMGQKEFLRLFRSCTSLIQTEQEYWILLDQISKLDKKIRNMELKKSKKTTVRSYKTDESSGKQERDMIFDNELHKLKQAREEKEHMFFTLLQNMKGKTGPVGESPVHICFLLGLTEMGKKILENHHQDINVTYQNDLLPLQLDKNESWTLRENENDSKRELGLHTGESLLHIAIVNEDTATVEYLLDKGIKISSTATGAFFQPRWVRPRVTDLTRWQSFMCWIAGIDSTVEKFAVVSREENAFSACYCGEYPLSFAASVGSVEICELLLSCKMSRLEDPSDLEESFLNKTRKSYMFVQDSTHKSQCSDHSSLWYFLNAIDYFGNTALHMAVHHRKKDVIDWLLSIDEAKASLDILNYDGFTPLTYAARLGYVDIFNHILFKHLSTTRWSFGKVLMRQIDLDQVDTYRIIPNKNASVMSGGRLNSINNKWRSALEIIVAHEVRAFAEDEIFQHLIQDKWNKFGRRMYFRRTVAPYILLLATFTATVMLRGADLERGHEAVSTGPGCRDFVAWVQRGDSADSATGNEESAAVRAVRLALEASLPLFWSPWLVWKGWRQRRLRYRDLDVDEDASISVQDLQHFFHKNMHFLLDILAAIALMTAGVALLCCWHTTHAELMAMASIFLFCNLLNVVLPFKSIGVLLITIYRMLVGDIARFCLVFFVLMVAFTMALHLLLQRWPLAEAEFAISGLNFGELFEKLLWIALGDNLGENGKFLVSHAESSTLTLLLFVSWVVLSSVLMLNLIIAMMGKTFNDSPCDTHRIWIFSFAALVLKYEKLLSVGQQKEFRTGSTKLRRALLGTVDTKKSYFEMIRVTGVEIGEDREDRRMREAEEAQRLALNPVVQDITHAFKLSLAEHHAAMQRAVDALHADHSARASAGDPWRGQKQHSGIRASNSVEIVHDGEDRPTLEEEDELRLAVRLVVEDIASNTTPGPSQ